MNRKSEGNMSTLRSRGILAVILVVIIVAAASLILAYGYLHFPNHSNTNPSTCDSILGIKVASGFAKSNFTASDANFAIIDSDQGPFEGMNGSYYHTFPTGAGSAGYNSTLQYWPVIQVKQNQTVSITIINCASSEPHGFAISHYFNAGVTLQSGQSYTFTFVASVVGRFSMYCNTFCSIHPYMQAGLLIVT